MRAGQDRYPRPAQAPAGPAPAPAVAALVEPIAATSSSAVVSLTHRLVTADGTINTSVGSYTDCTGTAPIDSDRADLDPCFPGRSYFVGHNPGVFAPLMRMTPGSLISWYDAKGTEHRLRIVYVRDFLRNSAVLQPSSPDVVAQFQTCVTLDGKLDRILDAVDA